jgi:hypothetical protein
LVGCRSKTPIDGMAGRPGAHAEPRAPEPTHPGAGTLGGFPLLPLPVTRKGRWRPLLAGHIATSAWAPNPVVSWLLCPRAALTQCLHLEAEPPRAPHQPLGVFPQSSIPQPRGEKGGEGGREGEEEEGARRPCRTEETEAPSMTKEPELRRDRTGTSTQGGRSGVGTLTPCTTTPRCPSSPSRPRLHRRPNVSTARPLSPFLSLGLFLC